MISKILCTEGQKHLPLSIRGCTRPLNTILDKNAKEIVDACQTYLEQYEKGNRHRFSPDIDGMIRALDGGGKK